MDNVKYVFLNVWMICCMFFCHANVRFLEHAGGLQDKEQPTQSQARHSQLSRQIEVSHGTGQCCSSCFFLSRILIFIPDPDFYSSRIPDPTTTTTKEEAKKNLLSFLFL
jgi:hypothetical protein